MIYHSAQCIEPVMRRLRLPYRFVPWESETEIAFRESLELGLASGVTLAHQVEAMSSFARFWLDAVLRRSDGYKIAVECDGKQHAWFRDLCRDSLCVGNKHVSVVYRFPSWCIRACYTEVFAILNAAEPWIFRESLRETIEQLYHPGRCIAARCTRLREGDKQLNEFLEIAGQCRGMSFARLMESYECFLKLRDESRESTIGR